MTADGLDAWIQALHARHLANLTFPEVSRALRALSSTYVERRRRLERGAAMTGAGKRAAFALFYGPLHFLLVREIVHALGADVPATSTLVDLGCGTGASGAAWALACPSPPPLLGIDAHPWCLGEAAWTYRTLGLEGRVRRGDVASVKFPRPPAAFLAAFAVNEVQERSREGLLRRLLDRAKAGDRILVVEPLAGFVAPWWEAWRAAFAASGGRADEWRFRVELPPLVAKLDGAAGLRHEEIVGRSLFV